MPESRFEAVRPFVMHVVGIALAVALGGLYMVAIRIIVRAPFRALGVLVAGMAFHNFLLMVMLRLGTPNILVRILQAWKEGIIVLLLLIAGRMAFRRWRSNALPRLLALDWMMAALAAVAIAYAIVPRLLPGSVTVSQAIVGARSTLLLPLLYLFGRVFWPTAREHVRWSLTAIFVAAAGVGAFGLVELWLVPTPTWLSWGVNQLSAWLGYAYHGPKGLPENFFQTTTGGLLLRRMVSTYVSPLGIAYTALLAIPVAAAILSRRGEWSRDLASRGRKLAPWAAFGLLLASALFSVTRLAIILAIFELAALALLLRRRSLAAATAATIAGAAFIVFAYPNVGPIETQNLQPVPRGAARHVIPIGGPSTAEHSDALAFDFRYVIAHPLGTGIGSSVHRYGPNTGTGESAIFDVFGDMGFLGGLLYVFVYALVLIKGAIAYLGNRGDPIASALPLVALIGGLALVPVTLTSSVWGDFSVTFLFWWSAGATTSMVIGPGRWAPLPAPMGGRG